MAPRDDVLRLDLRAEFVSPVLLQRAVLGLLTEIGYSPVTEMDTRASLCSASCHVQGNVTVPGSMTLARACVPYRLITWPSLSNTQFCSVWTPLPGCTSFSATSLLKPTASGTK